MNTQPTYRELIAELRAADTSEQDRLIEDILRTAHRTLKVIGMKMCRTFRCDPNTWFDDFTSIAQEQAWRTLKECVAKPDWEIASFEALVTYRTRGRVVDFINQMETPASGMSTLRRRQQKYNEVREQLTLALGREPRVDEVLETANEQIKQSYSNSKETPPYIKPSDPKQSTLPVHNIYGNDDEDSPAHDRSRSARASATPDHQDTVASELDVQTIMENTIALAARESDELRHIAQIMFAPIITDDAPAKISLVTIAKVTGLSRRTVEKGVARIREIAREQYDSGYPLRP